MQFHTISIEYFFFSIISIKLKNLPSESDTILAQNPIWERSADGRRHLT